MARHETRAVGGLVVGLLGVALLLAAAVCNGRTVEFWRGDASVDYADVYRLFFWTALLCGVGVLGLGIALARTRSRALPPLTLLVLMACGVVVADRFLLMHFGLPLWCYDQERHFQHRPNAVRRAHRGTALVRINRYGHHDEDFPREKPAGELRGLFLGDSITMGDKLRYEQTFCHKLEALLGEQDAEHASHQMINAGVQGYATKHELATLRRDLMFDPDFVVVGFCMNDVVEPFVVDRDKGGTGIDYHAVMQVPSPLMGYLLNETGFGRLIWWLKRADTALELRKRWEANNVLQMARDSRTEPRLVQAWDEIRADLAEIYRVAGEREIPVLLLVFPYTFQLLDETARVPQQLLAEHAADHGVAFLDLTERVRAAVYDDPLVLDVLEARGADRAEIESWFRARIGRLFFDTNHFTERGHDLIAEALYESLVSEGWVRPRGGR